MVIRHIYGKDGGLRGEVNRVRRSSVWCHIIDFVLDCKVKGVDLVSLVGNQIGNGESTRFWEDVWLGDNGSLASRFPRLYALESVKECRVSDRFVWEGSQWHSSWSWRCEPRGRACNDLEELRSILQAVEINPSSADRWVWKLDTSNSFSVHGTYLHLLKHFNGGVTPRSNFDWNNLVPIKVNVHLWRAMQDRLPSKDNLSKRCVPVADSLCALCKKELESSGHVFFRCCKVLGVWRKIFAWWKLPYPSILDWDLLSMSGGSGLDKEVLGFFQGVCFVTIWAIWFWRNKVIFSSEEDIKVWEHIDLFSFIQRKCLFWFSNRVRKKGFRWSVWTCNPRLVTM